MFRTVPCPLCEPGRFLQRGFARKASQNPVAITAFLGGHEAISGNIKARYEDFVVKEISHEGEIVESSREGSMFSDFKALQAASGRHARLVLAKENRDVADAVAMLARHLHIDARKVSFHGLKDRRAVTYQHISVPWALLDEKRLASCMSLSTWDPAVHISRLERQDVHCRMGRMLGNDFCIVVRDAQSAQGRTCDAAGKDKFRSLVEEASRSLRTLGFVNYFGRQRFGPSACSPAVGRAIASGHHEMACELLVCSMRSHQNREIEELFARGEFRRALAETPARCAVERRILQHLCISPADYSGALGSLPRRQRLLFARSFASLLWNQVVSARLAASGQEVFAGDLVLASREVGLQNVVTHRAKGMRPDVSLPEVRVVRPGEQRDIPFSDIVLPVPGDRCTYPAHPPTRRLYAQVLQGNNFPHSASSEGEQSYLEGTYRHAVAMPLSFRARTVVYKEPCSRLVVSALDHIKGRSLEPHGMFELSRDATTTDDVRAGVIVELALRPGQYATVAMREFMQGPPDNELSPD
ncbi:Multisubstrate pseudouridine synthase 7 [Symbiodinium microadriaticum]|uniref:Multisubstrate pseudouridine synthase 7 n=1 Tax=Symbiodinium microadriaticum TaxID=2951 RepID=A0A1Q9BX63_SYMMI|nr:Multisubstrate pseudouridine synthase 7 [Symbiodinium microadriaticum]